MLVEYVSRFLELVKGEIDESQYLEIEDCSVWGKELEGYKLVFPYVKKPDLQQAYAAKSEAQEKHFLSLFERNPVAVVRLPSSNAGISFTEGMMQFLDNDVNAFLRKFGLEPEVEETVDSLLLATDELQALDGMDDGIPTFEDFGLPTLTESETPSEVPVDQAEGLRTMMEMHSRMEQVANTAAPFEESQSEDVEARFEGTAGDGHTSDLEQSNPDVDTASSALADEEDKIFEDLESSRAESENYVDFTASREEVEVATSEVDESTPEYETSSSQDASVDTSSDNNETPLSEDEVDQQAEAGTVEGSEEETEEQSFSEPDSVTSEDTSTEVSEQKPVVLGVSAYNNTEHKDLVDRAFTALNELSSVMPEFRELFVTLSRHVFGESLSQTQTDVEVIPDGVFKDFMSALGTIDDSTSRQAYDFAIKRLWHDGNKKAVTEILDEVRFYHEEVINYGR